MAKRCRATAWRVNSEPSGVHSPAEGAIEMSEGATGLEPTIEITETDYPEIMRIVASDGEVDTYLASAGVADDVFGDDADAATASCVSERAALAGSLLYVVEVGEVAGTSISDGTVTLPISAANSLLGSVSDVMNE